MDRRQSVEKQSLRIDERMAVRTPEHVELNFLVAGAGNRFLALVADLLLQSLVFVGLFVVLGLVAWAAGGFFGDILRGIFSAKRGGLWLFAGIILIVFLVQWGYFTFFETIWSGQTPGKRLLRIRVLREDGRPVGFAEAAIRNLLRSVLDSQPFSTYAVGFVTGMLNDRFKRLGDFAAGTVVIRERRRAPLTRGHRPRIPAPPAPAGPAVRPLAPDEAATLHAYLRRRDELDAKTREEMGKRIANSLKQRLGVRQPEGMSFDAFLEWLDRESRGSQSFR
jgi:uncharacterized RDD family membrane protein YckC